MRCIVAAYACLLAVSLLMLVQGCGVSSRRPPGPGPDPAPNPQPTERFTLTGQVTDSSGAALNAVRILVGSLTSVTGPDGRFSFADLAAGGYVITLQDAQGHFDCRSIVLAQGQTNYDLQMPRVGAGFRATSVAPLLGSSGNALGSVIEIELSAAADAASLSPDDLRIVPEIGEYSVALANGGTSIILHPRLQLPLNQQLLVELLGEVRSQSGEPLNKPLRWNFRTALNDSSAPLLLGNEPAQGSSAVALNTALRFEFNETLSENQLALQLAAEPQIELQAEAAGRYLILRPAGGWEPSTTYQVRLQNVSDLAGNINSNLVSLTFTSGTQLQLAHNIQAEWNRVSGRIVFASDREGDYDLWSMAEDGSSVRRLTSSSANDFNPTLSEDGSLIAWQRRAVNGRWDIYVASLQDGQLGSTALLTPLDSNDFDPQFSRTPSKQLLFVSDRSGRNSLYTMNEDGSSPVELDAAFTTSSSEPCFHPLLDGQLLFTAYSGNTRNVWRKSVSIIDGSTVNTNLTQGRLSDDFAPSWGPDASFIVFLSSQEDRAALWLAEPTGDFARQVTSLPQTVRDPCVSPIAGDNRCLLTLDRADGGSDLVLVSLISGNILSNLTSPEEPGT